MKVSHLNLPDHPDVGCNENPVVNGCLRCPLPVCKYDVTPQILRAIKTDVKAKDALIAYNARISDYPHGSVVDQLAAEYVVTRRTIERWITRARQLEDVTTI